MHTSMRLSRSERGLNMIEVVVALALLGTVMLSISTLFIHAGRSVRSGKELTEATSVGTDILEELRDLTYEQLYGKFGGSDTDTTLVASTLTNSYASKWQPGIDQRLTTPHYQARATITLTPIGGPSTPPEFGDAVTTRVHVVVEWEEGQRHHTAEFATTRF